MDSPLRQLVYTSTTRQRVSRTGILDILRVSRPYNEALGVTGVLLYADSSFLQVLEGPPESVDDVYARVCRDPRHDAVMILADQEVETRAFPGWPLGFLRVGDMPETAQPALQSVLEMAEDGVGQVWSVVRAFRYVALARRTHGRL